MSKNRLTYKNFKKYFDNRQSSKQRQAFEQKVMQDAFDEEAFDGLSQLSPEEMEADIENLKFHLERRAQKRSRTIPMWISYAAGVAILTGVGIATLYFFNNELRRDMAFQEPLKENIAMSDTAPQEEPKILSEEPVQAEGSTQHTKKVHKETTVEKQVETEPQSSTTEENLILEMVDSEADEDLLTQEPPVQEKPETTKGDKQQKKPTETTINIADNNLPDQAQIAAKEETTATTREKSSTKNVVPTTSAVDAMAGISSENTKKSPATRNKAPQTTRDALPPGSLSMDQYKAEITKQIQKLTADTLTTKKTIYITLHIDNTGDIEKIDFSKAQSHELKQAIKDITKELGAWTPAIKRGEQVPADIQFDITLKVK